MHRSWRSRSPFEYFERIVDQLGRVGVGIDIDQARTNSESSLKMQLKHVAFLELQLARSGMGLLLMAVNGKTNGRTLN